MFLVTISTPHGEHRLDEVSRIVTHTDRGEMAVYPRHAPLIALLHPGVTRIHRGILTERWELSEGILEVHGNEVIFIVEQAVHLKAASSFSSL